MDENVFNQLDDPTNIEKYKVAGKTVSKTLDQLINKTKKGVTLEYLSNLGDELLKKNLKGAFSEDSINSICFPTCVCKNEYAGYLNCGKETVEEGDLVKYELGCSVDGFPALIAFTHYVKPEKEDKKSELKSKLLNCLNDMSKQILDAIKVDKRNTKLVETANKLAHQNGFNLLDGNLYQTEKHIPGQIFYQISRNCVFGKTEGNLDDSELHNLVIMRQSNNFDFDLVPQDFGREEVYFVDLAISSGTGRVNESDYPPTIYLRNVAKREPLRIASSRKTIAQFNPKVSFPVNIKDNKDIRFRLGLKECVSKGLLEPFYVTKEKKDQLIVRIGFTVILKEPTNENKNGQILISARSLNSEIKKFSSDTQY